MGPDVNALSGAAAGVVRVVAVAAAAVVLLLLAGERGKCSCEQEDNTEERANEAPLGRVHVYLDHKTETRGKKAAGTVDTRMDRIPSCQPGHPMSGRTPAGPILGQGYRQRGPAASGSPLHVMAP